MKRTCAIVPLALLCGCTIVQLRQHVSTQEHRVELKQDEVRNEEARRDALRSDMERLQADLGKREMTLEQLQARLGQLQRENARMEANTAAQIERKRQLNDQLDQYKDKLDELNKSPNMTAQEKQKRIAHLKREISKNLELKELELKAQQ